MRGGSTLNMKVMADGGEDTPQEGTGAFRVTYDDALLILKQDHEMRRESSRIPLAIVYFTLFVLMAFEHFPTGQLFAQSSAVQEILASSGTDAITSETTMKFFNIQQLDDVSEWLTNTLIPSVFITSDPNANLLPKDRWTRIALFNKVLGALEFEIVRATGVKECDTKSFLQKLYPQCIDTTGLETKYFYIPFDTNATNAVAALDQFKQTGQWLDEHLQKLTITIVTFNGEFQMFGTTHLIVTLARSGGCLDLFSRTTSVRSDPYHRAHAIVLDVLFLLVFLFIFCKEILKAWRLVIKCRKANNSSKFFRHLFDIWTIIEIVSLWLIVLFYGIWAVIVRSLYETEFRKNLATVVVSGQSWRDDSDERISFTAVTSQLKAIATYITALRIVGLCIVLLLGSRILKQFRFHKQLSIFTKTIGHALHQFGAFLIVFVVVYITFALAGEILFGDRVRGFSSFRSSLESCVNMLFGNFDFSVVQDSYPPVALFYYWGYMITVSLILLNMILAIILDAYSDITTNDKRGANGSFLRLFRQLLREFRDDSSHRVKRVIKLRKKHSLEETTVDLKSALAKALREDNSISGSTPITVEGLVALGLEESQAHQVLQMLREAYLEIHVEPQSKGSVTDRRKSAMFSFRERKSSTFTSLQENHQQVLLQIMNQLQSIETRLDLLKYMETRPADSSTDKN